MVILLIYYLFIGYIEIPIPALACIMHEVAAARFSPIIGETALITTPKQSAPVPESKQYQKTGTYSSLPYKTELP